MSEEIEPAKAQAIVRLLSGLNEIGCTVTFYKKRCDVFAVEIGDGTGFTIARESTWIKALVKCVSMRKEFLRFLIDLKLDESSPEKSPAD